MREMLRCAGPATALNDFRACHAYEPPSNLPLAVPTLIVTSEHDKLVGRKSAKALREKVSFPAQVGDNKQQSGQKNMKRNCASNDKNRLISNEKCIFFLFG